MSISHNALKGNILLDFYCLADWYRVALFWILADEAIKFVKKTLDYCNLRKVLILLQNYEAWLRSQAFNMEK